MGKKGTLREAPGGELKRLVRVAMYCFGKVGRKYLNKKREEERSVLLVTRSGPGLTDTTRGVQRPSCSPGTILAALLSTGAREHFIQNRGKL